MYAYIYIYTYIYYILYTMYILIDIPMSTISFFTQVDPGIMCL